MTVSAFDHPFLSGLLGDEEVGAFFSAGAELKALLDFEAALAAAEAEKRVIAEAAGKAVAEAIAGFAPDIGKLCEATARDGVVVPELVRQLRAAVGKPHAEYVHFGATSQDVVDTGFALRIGKVLDILQDRIEALIERLGELDMRDGAVPVMAHTRMQAAIEVPASRKILSWREPLLRHRARLSAVREGIAVLTFGGAAGTLDKLGSAGEQVAARMAKRLGLGLVPRARHSERDGQAELAGWLSLVTGSLGKMGADIALAAQSEIGEIRLKSGGGSSAMPHKVNPVGAEVLVSLARFNATLVSGMHQALVHENERSGTTWTLEWMLLPQMAVATGAALRAANELTANIEFTKDG
ncbi:3-carboxy-cis,cis-muconate cycloisomerase [Mesorhizobium koreense]|uniref:3-carboxy-cis,cis-muconate cycloisomerase n=1 Tax=Mesorhizobium koreense TaxID=3074855 RepID=UPI00287BC981|nr:3-carboxy-cis,cis-muconate cycloisomerase [Mesorhizobium sp. WR6]